MGQHEVSINERLREPDLLSLCALLRWFDQDVLRALVGEEDEKIEALLASDVVIPATELKGAYRLGEAIRVDALARLRAERPSQESTWHRRIFEYFLTQLDESGPAERKLASTDAILHHLGELFLIITARQEWHTLAELVALARAVSQLPSRMEHWLTFYDSFVLVRTQQYERGEAMLLALQSEPDLAIELRVQVLNAQGQLHWFQAH
jgi:hypothetical protein